VQRASEAVRKTECRGHINNNKEGEVHNGGDLLKKKDRGKRAKENRIQKRGELWASRHDTAFQQKKKGDGAHATEKAKKAWKTFETRKKQRVP